MKMKFLDSEIYYKISGKGDPLVLLHGFLESSRIWDEFIPEFSKYGQIIQIDLPGHGRSGVQSEVHSMELMADAVHAVLIELNIEKADFIGHSMGGYVGLAFMEQYPEMIKDFMLLNSTPQEDSEEKKEIRSRSVDIVKRNKEAYISMAITNLLSPQNNKRYKKEVEILKQDAYTFPTEGITAALLGMKIRKDRSQVLKEFSGNKVIVTGTEDPLFDIEIIKLLAKETGCSFFGFKGGHLGFLENKAEFVKLCLS